MVGVSRANIWAYASLVASEVSQNNLVCTDTFKVGHQNCETVGTCNSADPLFCASNGPDQGSDFPSPDLMTHQLLYFKAERCGFDADQTVVIMGAHTLGRALSDTSGFDGKDGWVDEEFNLDNEYFGELVGGGGNNNKNTNLETLADGPNWDLIEIDNTGRSFRNMFQWIHSGGGQDNDDCRLRNLQRGGGGGQGKGGSGGGGGGNIKIMLNVDIIAIIRDLGI